MSRTLLIAEHENGTLNPATLAALSAAVIFNQDVDVLLAGEQCSDIAALLQSFEQIDTVMLAEHPAYAHQLPEALAPLIHQIAGDYSVILAAATTSGKNLLPRVAALLDVAQISDVVEIVTPDTFVRPVYAGSALATVESLDPVKVLTIRATAFDQAASGSGQSRIEKLDITVEQAQSRFITEKNTGGDGPSLDNARVVVAGGRGLQTQENFSLLEQLADRLGAAVGASRAAVDAGLAGNELQVGQTGRIVAPELYIAVGISGAIQHLAGMKDSKVIVAINKDPDAPIFNVADFGLVADLEQALPELLTLL